MFFESRTFPNFKSNKSSMACFIIHVLLNTEFQIATHFCINLSVAKMSATVPVEKVSWTKQCNVDCVYISLLPNY